MAYATRDQLFSLALAAPAFVAYPRPFDAVDGPTATIRIKGHGLSLSDVITFERSDGGTLPTGLSEWATYYPVPVTADLFRVALASGGTPIASWANTGAGWGVTVDQYRRLDMHLEEVSAFVDEHLTAHEPPILPDQSGNYPWVLVGIVARIAARRAISSLEVENPQYRVPIDRLLATEEADKQLLADWKAGKPIQPRPEDETSTADNSARAQYSREPVPWTTGMI